MSRNSGRLTRLRKRAPDLQALLDAVEAQRPDLIFIDTLAVAFGSFDENSAEPMNQIVRVARAFTTWGAAVDPPRSFPRTIRASSLTRCRRSRAQAGA